MVTVAEALEKLKVTRATFYDAIKQSKRPIRRWRYVGDRRVRYDMRQLKPLFTKPRLLKG